MAGQELMDMVNPRLRAYVEGKVFPLYDQNDEGHRLPHIRYVIRRSLFFGNQFDGLDLNMCYVMAAYHDVGHHVDKDTHELISAQIFMDDEKMKIFFTDAEREIIKEAIEDHRSSLKGEPRNQYGKVLSSADRSIDLNTSMRRTHAYTLKHFSHSTDFEMVARAYHHIKEKYGKDGYAKTYVVDEEFERNKQEVDTILQNPMAFFHRYLEVNHMYPEVGIDEELAISLLGKKQYGVLKQLHQRKYELKILGQGVKLNKPFVIEFTGMPRTGKTSIIASLQDFFKKAGFKVKIIEEFTSSAYFKNVMRPKSIEEKISIGELNLRIMNEVHHQILEAYTLEENFDIIIIDRGINDRQIWNYLRFKSGDISSMDYSSITELYEQVSKNLVNMLVIMDADEKVVLKRDFASCIALEKRNFLTLPNLEAFKCALKAKKSLLQESVEKAVWVNTSTRRIESILSTVTHEILNTMKAKYAEKLEF